MVNSLPVIQDESPHKRNNAIFAMSSGVPSFFNKVAFFAFSTASSGFLKALTDAHNKRGVYRSWT